MKIGGQGRNRTTDTRIFSYGLGELPSNCMCCRIIALVSQHHELMRDKATMLGLDHCRNYPAFERDQLLYGYTKALCH